MMKNIKHWFIFAAVAALAALAASCMNPLDPPSAIIAGDQGRVVLTISPGTDGSARTILPTETLVFSRYELDFTGGSSPVTNVSATPAEIAAGLNQELTAGTSWIVTVRAYRNFTPSGGTVKEYLAARGSAPVTVTAGEITPVTVSIAPVPVTDTTVKGIFTYTVSFPNFVSTATLTLTGESPINITSDQKVSLELDPGYYDFTISLENVGGTLTAGASEKVHIYSGLESAMAYTFTDADFAQTIPLAGTVTLPGGVTVNAGYIRVYLESSHTSRIQMAEIPAGGTAWAAGVSVNVAGSTLYFKLDAFGSDGNIYTATGDTGGAVLAAGMRGITLSANQGTLVSLPNDTTWEVGTLVTKDQADWYTVTAGAAGIYSLQWDDGYNSSGSYSAELSVWIYRSDGSPMFTSMASGYTYPTAFSLSAGETVYVMVASYTTLGDYAIRYYAPALPGKPELLPDNWKTLDYNGWKAWYDGLDLDAITEEVGYSINNFIGTHFTELSEGGQKFWQELIDSSGGGDYEPAPREETYEFTFDNNETLTINPYHRGGDGDAYTWQSEGRGTFPVGLWIHYSGANQETLTFTADTLKSYSPFFGTWQFDWELSGTTFNLTKGEYLPSQEELDEVANFNESAFRAERPWIPATSTIDPRIGSGEVDYHIIDHPVMTPFVNDSAVIGVWTVVDYISEIDDFDPTDIQWTGSYWIGVEFVSGGTLKTQFDGWAWENNGKWTKGLISGVPGSGQAPEYEIKPVSGTAYLFVQWKSGDYSIRGRKPSYYVFKK
jgi:hypothetical protein